jgi:hypothetical protein
MAYDISPDKPTDRDPRYGRTRTREPALFKVPTRLLRAAIAEMDAIDPHLEASGVAHIYAGPNMVELVRTLERQRKQAKQHKPS